MTKNEIEEFCWNNNVPKTRMNKTVTVEIGGIAQRIKVHRITEPTILQMALSLTDMRHRKPTVLIVAKIGKTKVRVYGLGE